MISIVAAAARNNVIGNGNALPWDLPADLKHFREVTAGHAIIMGRKTFESIGRPLPNRKNIIITRHPDYHPEGVHVVSSIEEAVQEAKLTPLGEPEEEIFVIGGGEIFKMALPMTDRVYLTRIEEDVEGDAFFPVLEPGEWRETNRREGIVDEKNALPHTFLIYERIR